MRFSLILSFCVLLLGIMVAAPDAGAQNMNVEPAAGQDTPWSLRCDPPGAARADATYCEIFQRLVVKETQQRFMELAVGYPAGSGSEADRKARGIFVLPLGMALPPGAQVQVDNHAAIPFAMRYCDAGGCYAHVTLDARTVDHMRRGRQAVVTFRTREGGPMRVPLSLKGFTKALESAR